MKSNTTTVKVRILDKEVQIGCAKGEESDLARAAQYVDASMHDFRGRNMSASTEKIAIITAINMANELLKLHTGAPPDAEVQSRLDKLRASLDAALAE